MILQALVDYYKALAACGKIAQPGWANVKISHAMEIDDDGKLLLIHPLKEKDKTGKKLIPRMIELPAPIMRTVDVAANLGWDNAMYMLGLHSKGKPERTKQCFAAARELHLKLLGELDDPFVKAICAFFNSWDIETAHENPNVAAIAEDLAAGENLVFMYQGILASKNQALRAAWQSSYDSDKEGETMCCLITGQNVVPEATHPQIKNVRDAQSSGAALISFNASAFCSYDREQNLNAPIGKYAAFAYTTALNQLLSDNDKVVHIGDSTVVFRAESAEEQYPSALVQFMNADNNITDADLKSVMKKLSQGRVVDWNGLPLKPDNRFYVLGLSPNASRISVRFFLRDSFGNFAKHLQSHYERLEIEPEFDNNTSLPIWKLLRETVNPNANDKKAAPQMSGDVMRAILTGGRYPSTLYQGVQLRIRADRKINYTRAAIIKAYLLRNTTNNACREVLTVQLNKDTRYQPYILGRLFSVLESIQNAANPGINTTIKDKYISAACATPAKIFPTLLNLSEKHLRKLDKGLDVHYSKQVQELLSLIDTSYPAHHSIEDQGIFQIGYYHQTQKRYEKNNTTSNNKEVN